MTTPATDPLADAKTRIGYGRSYDRADPETRRILDYINLKLAARGFQIVGKEEDFPFLTMGRGLLAHFQERLRQLGHQLCPADARIDSWLRRYLADLPADTLPEGLPLVPAEALALEQHGIARLLSLPAEGDTFRSDIVSSFRTARGVCHNPAADRRTTAGVFHVTEGGLPIPADKKSVPKATFARLLLAALDPPASLRTVPFTSGQTEPSQAFLSLLLRPTVSPKIPGLQPRRSLETRFFAPGNLVSNLDFVESIFGNAGDPHLPENDAALDPEHWSGHTGCVILAPHLTTLRKKDVGLPPHSEATERQRHDGMCWEDEDEIYNDGGAFKITARDEEGVMVTLIADNYFGYCKKEVKTQISFACNLLGNAEEEHAGGCLAFPTFDHGEWFELHPRDKRVASATFADTLRLLGDRAIPREGGYAVDANFPDIAYIPENAAINLRTQSVSWPGPGDGEEVSIRLEPEVSYLYPSGYKVAMQQPSTGQRWRLVGTQAEGTFCHKPCTVSGGGKSEISKPFDDAMVEGPVIVPRFSETLEETRAILEKNFWDRWKKPRITAGESRPFLDTRRSLGSALRLFQPNDQYSEAYNDWLASLRPPAVDLALIIKRVYKPKWGGLEAWDDWSRRFAVDSVNGDEGFQLKYRDQPLAKRYVRVGFTTGGRWRTFSLRKDFLPAVKLQREDDISASAVLAVPEGAGLHPDLPRDRSYKFVENCEFRLFQRPDDAIHRGYDSTTETDFAKPGNFFSNYEPLDSDAVQKQQDSTLNYVRYTAPIKETIGSFLNADEGQPEFLILPSHPRLVDGKPTKNPRYLQSRTDLDDPRPIYLADVGMHLYRGVPIDEPVLTPVNAVLPGRRLNPPDPEAGIRNLAVFGPLHYQELPELFMDYIASLTGKSPSTTGAGSEGALTKGPFNALLPVHDLNAALLAAILTRGAAFSSAAGFIGPNYKVDHDISLVVPELWSRMHIHEREPQFLIENGMLEKLEDFKHEGETILASRLGWRINEAFVDRFFGRIFSVPLAVFPDDMLRPEKQDNEAFVDGIKNITETMAKVAKNYFEDGSVEEAVPPLRAILHVMAHGEWEGHGAEAPELRQLFDRDAVLNSDWFQERLKRKAAVESRLLERQRQALAQFAKRPGYESQIATLKVRERLASLPESAPAPKSFTGTTGA